MKKFIFPLILLGMGVILASSQPTRRRTREIQKGERAISNQIKQLQKLRCKPRLQKLDIPNLLTDNDLLDKQFRPRVLAIKRCDESCSYCGKESGIETKKCLPVKVRNKTFHLIEYGEQGERNYITFEAEEHKKCACM